MRPLRLVLNVVGFVLAPAAIAGKSADNFGFAAWVQANAGELVKLGPGRHFGEWWGQGIQRNYGLTEKRFSLFNVRRWADTHTAPPEGDNTTLVDLLSMKWAPKCCHVVPTLGTLDFETDEIMRTLDVLREHGSVAAPGFMKPEGVVIFHTQSGALFKKTFDKDDAGKGKEPERDMAA